MFIHEHPRLVLEIPRGSERYNKIHSLRSAAERTNSSLKADLTMLDHPKVLGILHSSVLAQMSCIVLLLKKTFDFIVRISLLAMKC